jgi:hypothetical protein
VKTFSLFARKEHFFVLEIRPGSVSGLRVAVGEDKKITITRTLTDVPWGNRIAWENTFRFPKVMPVVALDFSLSHTVFIPVAHVRERIRDPLGESELTDILSQHVGRALSQCRKDAARELGVDELDALLAKAQVASFKIDTHNVLNPLGFRTQRVEALVRLTFTSRSVFNEAKRIIGTQSQIFFSDIANAELMALERVSALPFNLLFIRPYGTTRFSAEQSPAGYEVERGNLVWRAGGFEEAIADAWGVSIATAKRLYDARIAGAPSVVTTRFFDRLFLPRTRSFFAEIGAMKLKGPFHIDTDMNLPFPIVGKKGGMVFSDMPIARLADRLGFSVDAEGLSLASRPLFRLLSVFFERYYDKSDSAMNAWLTKHLSWLGSPVERKE